MPFVGQGILMFLRVDQLRASQRFLLIGHVLAHSWSTSTVFMVTVRSLWVKIAIFMYVNRDVQYIRVLVKRLLNPVTYTDQLREE